MTTQPTEAEFFVHDEDAYDKFLADGVFRKDLRHFQTTYVTPRALLCMMKHAIKGCDPRPREILGFLSGRAVGKSFFITDAIPFAVEGTETRVGATDECMCELIEHNDCMKRVGRMEPNCGWYHSHPGLWCFFSEIDVRTHRQNQMGYGAFTGLVIDPINTISSGKINLGSYVTFPESPEIDSVEATESIPPDVLMKYGIAANKYYELDLKYFKSEIDTKVLTDITTRSYGQAIACSPLQLNASYVASQVKAAADTMNRDDGTKKHVIDQALKTIKRVNEARKSGIWIEKMKRAAFG